MARKKIDDVLGGGKGRGSASNHRPIIRSVGGKTKFRTVVKTRFHSLSNKEGKTSPQRTLGRASTAMKGLNYAAMRPDHSKQRINRDIITNEGRVNYQDGEHVQQKIFNDLKNAQEEYIYRTVLSIGESASLQETEEWAKRVVEQQGYEKYYIVVHAGEQGHTEHPHAHVFILTDERMTRDDFINMKRTGDYESSWQRHLGLQVMELRDQVLERLSGSKGGSGGGQADLETESEEKERKPKLDMDFD